MVSHLRWRRCWVTAVVVIIIIIIIMKSFKSLWSRGHPWKVSSHCGTQLRSIIFLYFLSHPPLSFATFSSAYLSFYIPEDSNLMQFSLQSPPWEPENSQLSATWQSCKIGFASWWLTQLNSHGLPIPAKQNRLKSPPKRPYRLRPT